jgi:hypothetical protein
MVNSKLLLKYIVYIVFLCTACQKGDIPLTLVAKPINSNILRFDGYYYKKISDGSDPLIRIYFLYKNGVLHYTGDPNKSKLEDHLKYIITKPYWESRQKDASKDSWGIFTIENQNIEYQRLYDGGSRRRPMKYCKGEILNDATFLITECTNFAIGRGEDKTFTVNDTFHFKRFSPKVDSLNPWYP